MAFDIILKLSYGVMIAAIVLCFLLMKRQQRSLRLTVNRFAFAFVKISNHVSPKPPREKLKMQNGHALPLESQPAALQEIISRAGDSEVIDLYGELTETLEALQKLCGKNRKLKEQFYAPVEGLFNIARTFLVGCENLENINSPARSEDWNSFLTEQLSHRKLLLRRISGDAGPDYAMLNTQYDLKKLEL